MSASISFDWFHWFDMLVLGVLGLGIFLGRRSTALEQIVGLIRWTLVIVICAFLYKAPAGWISGLVEKRPDVIALMLYPVLVLIVYILLGFVREAVVGKTNKMELFGKREHQISAVFGMLRMFVILFLAMAWLHGRYVTADDVRDYRAFCRENFGSITWPALCTMQEDVFDKAYVGKAARSYVSALLMTPIPPPASILAAEAKDREKEAKARELAAKNFKAPGTADAIINEVETHGKKTGTNDLPSKSDLTGQTIYHQLTLKGISGIGGNRLALINNQALKAGETELIKVESSKMKVLCKEIREASVLIQVEDKPEIIELRLSAPSTNATKTVTGKS